MWYYLTAINSFKIFKNDFQKKLKFILFDVLRNLRILEINIKQIFINGHKSI